MDRKEQTNVSRSEIPIEMRLNGKTYRIEVDPRLTLLELLRDHLEIRSVHSGCDEGECGACTVLLDGRPICSCLILAVQVRGASITTVEGLVKENEIHPLMSAFIENDALQCGYCTPGFILTSYYLLNSSKCHTERDYRKGLEGNLCRCMGYVNILHAIERAKKHMDSGNWW